MATEKAPNVPPFVSFCTASVPMVFDNSMSYYECLCALSKYLQDLANTVNFNATQLDGLQESFKMLKDYVDNYFANLDVQQEINNKLDEMAEGGELAAIIAQFLAASPVFGYKTVSDMVEATNLIANSVAQTAGFHSEGTGGAMYLIREPLESETANGYNIIELDNGLFAQLIDNGKINVDQYGAYGDGVHDDYDAIQFAISNNLHHTICFSDRVYGIGSTLKTWATLSKKTMFSLEKTTKIKALDNLTALIEFGGLGGTFEAIADRRKIISGGILDATNCDCAIKIATNDGDVEIKECEIINVGNYGIYVPYVNESSNITIDNVIIYGIGADYTTYGIYCSRPDNFFRNSHVRGCRYGLYFTDNAGGQQIMNVDGLGFGSSDPWFDTSCFLTIAGRLNHITNSYCDTFKTFAVLNGDLVVSNCIYYSYKQNVDVELFKLNDTAYRLTLTDNTFTMPNPANYHKGISFTGDGVGDNTMMVCRNIITENNIIRNFNDQNVNEFNDGDLLLANDKSFSSYYHYLERFANTTDWVKIGNIMEGNFIYNLDIDINYKHFETSFYVQRSGSTTTVQNYGTSKNDENITVQLGFVYQNDYNGYKSYGVYMRQTAGTQMWVNPVVKNNAPSKFIAPKYTLGRPELETMTIDSTITI